MAKKAKTVAASRQQQWGMGQIEETAARLVDLLGLTRPATD